MATLQAHNLLSSSSSSSSSSPSSCRRRRICASLQTPTNLRIANKSHLKPPTTMINMQELRLREDPECNTATHSLPSNDESSLVTRLYAIAEAAADRAEMHANIGEQRNNWAHLLLNSTNSITLAASIMAGASAIPAPHVQLAFKLSSAVLFAAAAGMMLVANKIQPSQLAEEQRNATRLFRQLERSIHTTLALRPPTKADDEEAMEKVLALDKAYPLSLLPGMLEKFPATVEPTVWWPKLNNRRRPQAKGTNMNGWSKELEEEMKGVLRVLKEKDTEDYVRTAKLALQINTALAISGPLLAGVAAVSAGLIGTPALGQLPVLVGVVGGAVAAAANALEHGGQVGMVFELFRNCAGFYRQLEEEIESNLGERETERRENGELFEAKVALRLGRSLSEMKPLAPYASSTRSDGEGISEFAGKLF